MNSRLAVIGALVLFLAGTLALRLTGPQAVDTPGDNPASSASAEAPAPSAELEATDASEEAPREAVETTDLGDEQPQPSVDEASRILRVIVDGIPKDQASRTTVTLTGDAGEEYWPSHVSDSWSCTGLTSEFSMERFFQRVAQASHWNLDPSALQVEVYHPERSIETVRLPLSSGVPTEGGGTLYEVRVTLLPGTPYVFWPELTLSVLHARSRDHLQGVELRCVNTALMGIGQQPGDVPLYSRVGQNLSSPIPLLGGRPEGDSDEFVSGLAIGEPSGSAPRLRSLFQPEEVGRGVIVYARAPGYAWGRFVLDVSKGTDHELLLEPGASLKVQLANLQFERYELLDAAPTLTIGRVNGDGETERVSYYELDEVSAAEPIHIDSLLTGGHFARVELGGRYNWKQRPVLALQEFALVAGETHSLVLTLDDPPAPRPLTSLSGSISLPEYPGIASASLQLYDASTYENGAADIEFALADLPRVSGDLPTWSFEVEELPAGTYQAELWPVMKSWMIEVPEGGSDVQLVLDGLAEVLVETVDAGTGERIPLQDIRYGDLEDLPGKVRNQWVRSQFVDEPGLFRIWLAPGPAYVKTNQMPEGLNYGFVAQLLDVSPGLQSVLFEVTPLYAIEFEFRLNGEALPEGDQVYFDVLSTLRAVDHDGHPQPISMGYVEMDAPGLYEVTFEGVGLDRFHAIPPRQVEVTGGEATQVIVDLQRK